MRRRRGALLAAPLAVGLLLAACSGKGGGSPVSGGTLKVSVRDLGSLDPATTTGGGGPLVVAQLFDSLTKIDPSTGRAKSSAASSWTVSADGLTWTFTIAPATFHDGTPVTAADFKAAFDRIAAKATGSEIAFQLEAVHGFHAAKIDGTASGLDGVQAVDATTLKIVLDRPFDELPVFLADPSLAPLPKAMIANPALLQSQPVGNGPFKMAGPRTPDKVMLERFDGHAGHKAYLDKVEVDLNGDATQAWRDFLAKRTDVAEVPSDAIADSAGKAGTGGFTPRWAALYYGLNLHSPVFVKGTLRLAVSLAIDRKHIADSVFGGTKEPATAIIPRGVRGFQEGLCPVCEQNQDRARQLIQETFGNKPPELIIDHIDAPTSQDVATSVAADLKDVGINAALRAHKSGDYLKFLQSGQAEIIELGWISDVPSPDAYLEHQLGGDSVDNHTGYGDAKFDSLIDKARAASDETARLDFYRQAEAQSYAAMPLIPIVFYRNHIGVADRVHGLLVDGAGIFDAAQVWVDHS